MSTSSTQSTRCVDFAFADLKAQTATVFLVLPPDRLDAYSRWLRLLVAQGFCQVLRQPVSPELG
jgi:type IV secretion system protein VirD4